MTIKRGNKGLFPYLGDYSPVNIYKGETKLAGWKWQSESGKVLQFQNDYKDVVHVEVDGKSVQDGIPSPDYPRAIKSLDKSFDIVSSMGKENLLPDAKEMLIMPDTRYLTYKLSRPILPNEEFTISIGSREWITKVRDHQTVFISPRDTKGGTSIGDGVSGLHSIPIGGSKTISFSESQYKIDTILFYSADINGVFGNQEIYKDVKVELGSRTPYSQAPEEIQYNTQSPTLYKTNISLSEPLRSVGDVKDRLFLDSDGLWKVERNVGEVKFTGSEAWQAEGSYLATNNYAHTVRSGIKSGGAISSNLLPEGAFESQSKENIDTTSVIILTLSNTRTGVVSSDTVAQRSAKFKTWVTANPMTVQYELATPTIETLSSEQQTKLNNIQSFKGGNYVYTMVSSGILPELHGKMKVKEI